MLEMQLRGVQDPQATSVDCEGKPEKRTLFSIIKKKKTTSVDCGRKPEKRTLFSIIKRKRQLQQIQ